MPEPQGNFGATLGPDAPSGCNDLRVDFEQVVPNVLIVLDRSGSMFEHAYGTSSNRWDGVGQALLGDNSSVVAELQNRVAFGLLTYTSHTAQQQCPVLSEVAPELGNLPQLKALYEEQSVRPAFKADTPTGAAITAAHQRLAKLPADQPRHILLVTDGEPDDCRTADPQCGQDLAVAATQAAYADGISMSVVGISNDVTHRHLQDLANAGSGQPVQQPDMQYVYRCINPGFASLTADYAPASGQEGSAKVYQPDGAAGLEEALHALVRGVADCGFQLAGAVNLDQVQHGTVVLDGTSLVYQDSDGWQMRNPRVVELLGAACSRAKTASEQLVISFPCDAVELL